MTDANLIIEFLSPSTRDYDAGENYYRSLPSFQEYLMISQDEYRVEHHSSFAAGQQSVVACCLPNSPARTPDPTIPVATLPGVNLI